LSQPNNGGFAGLTQAEAEDRLRTYGPNLVAAGRRRSHVSMVLSYFKSPLVIILVFAGAISAFVGELVNAGIIYFVVGMSVILGFYQEAKAENAAAALRARIRTTASVRRDGQRVEIPVSEVVPGDLVYLSAGDLVPADGKVFSAKDLFVDQAALSGESFPAEKYPSWDVVSKTEATEAKTDVDHTDLVFMGTSVVSGTGTISITKTGASTAFGEIAKQLVGRVPDTEFDRGLRRFGFLIMQVTLLLVIFVFFINALFKRDVLTSLLFSVALAVGLTPELLPMIVTINLATGAMHMAEKGVIARRLSTIQNFGSMDTLCTDKTGTLTENKITLTSHVDVNNKESDDVLLLAEINSSFQSGLRTPLDNAILACKSLDMTKYESVDEIPFDFVRRRVSVVVADSSTRLLISKGATNEMLEACSLYEADNQELPISDEVKKKVKAQYRRLSTKGMRVLAVARKNVEEKPSYTVNDETEMVYVGLLSFMDPPKQSAPASLQLLAESGVALKILTGDNEFVAAHICHELKIKMSRIVTGEQLRKTSDAALLRIVEERNVFARVTPDQKDRIMVALRKNGHVVGFMGDGINDAASIRTADVGISVDNAVDVAKAAADIILLQNDLTVLAQGVQEGRKTLANTMKYIMMGTSSNFGNMFSAAGASLFLSFLPMLPSQILVNNLLYDVSELAVPTDHVDSEYLKTPRRWDIHFVREFMLFFGPVSSIFDYLTFGVMLFVFAAPAALFQTAWFLESISTQTLIIFVIRTRRTPFYRSHPSKPLIFSTLAVVIGAMLLPFTPIGRLLGLVIPPPTFYIALAIFIGAYLMLAEALKHFFYRRLARNA
jgi:P-type Mg2+ transporter